MLRKLITKLSLVLALGAGLISLAPSPASADSFSLSYGSGGYHGGGRHGGWHGDRGWGGGHRGGWHSRPYYRPYYYDPYPPVIYEEPIIVRPAPRVVSPIQYEEEYYVPQQQAQPAPQNNGNCREYQTRVKINGKYQDAYGTSCQQPDGSWQNAD